MAGASWTTTRLPPSMVMTSKSSAAIEIQALSGEAAITADGVAGVAVVNAWAGC